MRRKTNPAKSDFTISDGILQGYQSAFEYLTNRVTGRGRHSAYKKRKEFNNVEWRNKKKKVAKEIRRTLTQWEDMLSVTNKGNWSKRLISDLVAWVGRRHGELTYHLTQVLSNNG